ncbi:MAG: molybdopterin molybdotransferase MoeA [Gudongella sp.]|jgi:molybdopterin molybdotransferase|nr:molybdopterin molybdotransferase MoeA [Gudongella sp.]
MDFFKVESVDRAREIILNEFSALELSIEEVCIDESLGRTLGEDLISLENVPDFNRSTVDGYAIVAEDSYGATDSVPSLLTIKGEVRMGEEAAIEINSGDTVYVPTGAMVPKGATAVVMIEHTEKMSDDTLLLHKPLGKGENLILRGEDTKKGDVVLKRGTLMTAQAVGVMASLGISKVKVFKKPRVYIISTGDEVIEIDKNPGMGEIRDINSYALAALIKNLGGDVSGRIIIGDNYDELLNGVKHGLECADIVLLSGGSSVGTRDYTHKVIDALGGKGVLVHGLAIKPGKPTIIGDGNGKLVAGLPGHPVSSVVVFKALIQPYILSLMNRDDIMPQVRAVVTHNFPSSPGKETYYMVSVGKNDSGYTVTPSFGKSGMISLMTKSQGYIVIGEHEEGINKGEERDVYLI